MITIPDPEIILQWNISQLIEKIPLIESILLEQGIEPDLLSAIPLIDILTTCAKEHNQSLKSLIDTMFNRLHELDALINSRSEIQSLEILSGIDKSGFAEKVERLSLSRGDLISIVGPTGSGKSRLLSDIEWIASGDTPSQRVVYINGKPSDPERIYSGSDRLIAQLSQTMSFVLDSTVEELLILHAESRGMDCSIISKTLHAANELSGEPFQGTTPLTSLSGGQSRALMIADTAILCHSPIVLIDEIENAGIDRRKALDLLVSEEKIVILATHDPLLALLAPQRICMSNGGMSSLKSRTEKEISILNSLEAMDTIFCKIRSQLRSGEELMEISTSSHE